MLYINNILFIKKLTSPNYYAGTARVLPGNGVKNKVTMSKTDYSYIKKDGLVTLRVTFMPANT